MYHYKRIFVDCIYYLFNIINIIMITNTDVTGPDFYLPHKLFEITTNLIYFGINLFTYIYQTTGLRRFL